MHKEYRTVHIKLIRLWNEIQKHPLKDDRERVLIHQIEAMWDILESMCLLVEKKRGVAAFILCRSLFEYSAVTEVLVRSTDRQLLTDYIDSGKLIVYEVGKAMGAPHDWLAFQQQEYEAIRARMGRKKWYGSTKIEDLVNKSHPGQLLSVGKSGLYKTFYKQASSLGHGDSYVFLSHTHEKGWQLTFDRGDRAEWGILGLSLAYRILAGVLHTVQEAFGMDLNNQFLALIPALEALPPPLAPTAH